MKPTTNVLILIFSVLTLSIYNFGQDEPIRVERDMVTINVAVVDAAGKHVPGLSRGQFEIFDDRKKQKIEHFSADNAGVTFGIVYDMHPTTIERTRAVLDGLRQFTRGLPTNDDFFLLVFNERGSLNLDFIPDIEQLERHLASPESREPRSLYDALYLAAGELRQHRNLKKTLLVVTDSADHNSRHSFNELRRELGTFDVQVYAITPDERWDRFGGYYDLTRRPGALAKITSDATAIDRAALNSITLKSGGGTYNSRLEDQRRIFEIATRIAEEMRRQYTISFYPADVVDGKWHSFRVGLRDVPGSKRFVLTYRQGYRSRSKTK